MLKAQADLGLDVVTDGEMERGAYYMQVIELRELHIIGIYIKPLLCNNHFHIICKIFSVMSNFDRVDLEEN